MSALERNPKVLAPTPHKILGPGIDGRGIREARELLPWGLAFPEQISDAMLMHQIGRKLAQYFDNQSAVPVPIDYHPVLVC